MSSKSPTPAMAQFHAAKSQYPDALLFFRMGDFYELFYEDAKTASRELGIALTSRSKGADAIPMAGVPVRAIDTYLQRLIRAGHRVAVCDQVQDPREATGVVERRVVRVVTPGTITEDSMLVDGRPNHLLAVHPGKGRMGLAWVELSTGRFRIHEIDGARLADELQRIEPSEVLLSEDLREDPEFLAVLQKVPRTWRPPYDFGSETAERALLEFFDTATLAGFGVEATPLPVGAAGALITYLGETQLAALPHITRLEVYREGRHMLLDRATRHSLELVETMRGEGSGTTVLKVLDQTRTPMGARLLREWLLTPLVILDEIEQRQEAVASLHERPALATLIRDRLTKVLDLERLTARIACGRANGRDLVALGNSLGVLPELCTALHAEDHPALQDLGTAIDPLREVADGIAGALIDDPPATVREGGMIRPGHDPQLDELLHLARDSRSWLAEYQQREVLRTGVSTLKIGFNKVFGYYIEITHAHRGASLPQDYIRKQTTKNAERYITDELKSFETKVLDAEEKARDLEYDLFCALREQVAGQTVALQATAMAVARLDVFAGLAEVARNRNYRRPILDDSRALEVEEGRHPVIETTHGAGTFVPNDTCLDPPTRQLVLLTGPNMAGKSTYIRQNALLVLLAQMGSFVPASRARIGIVDRIFTRVGAADDISRGASTFMVEMTETANILHNATDRSLVILDEVGRGTSTYDGLSLAWAIAEDLRDRIGCRTLFATHYHQMTDLAEDGRGIVNQRVAVREWGNDIVFLHRIEEGGTDKSYGLHVGRLAGLPGAVLERARAILERLEDEGESVRAALVGPALEVPRPRQLSLFAHPKDPIREDLERLDLDHLTPVQALQKLAEWQGRPHQGAADQG